MKLADFLHIYSIRSPHIMWFLGAGASASAGVGTAWDMIWDFKRRLYCAEQKVSIKQCENLSDDRVRDRIQAHFDIKPGFPQLNSEDEYAFYFETLYPSREDRRRYIDQLVSNGKPSYGHRILAALLKMDKARIVWTTNFDRVIEDALQPLLDSSGKLLVANLDNSSIAIDALNSGRWPLLVKLHGDFQSSRLKNINQELQKQDADLRYALKEACKRYGLAVVGYSGRDTSIMNVFEEVLQSEKPFPQGLFWFHRPGSPVFDRVSHLIEKSTAKGVEAHIIEVETFDELMPDLLLLEPNIPPEIEKYIDQVPKRVTNAPIPVSEGDWPVIRFNAMLVESWPNLCRLVKCDIGGQREVNKAVEDSNTDILAYRRRLGVLAFGRDAEVRSVFEPYNIKDYDLHTIADSRLDFDSQELELLYDALARAIDRECPVRVVHGRTHMVRVDPSQEHDRVYLSLRNAVGGKLSGKAPSTNISWAEAIRLKLERRLGRVWLLIEPAIWLNYSDDEQQNETAKEFVRDRLARRYNKQWNNLIDGWASLLTAQQMRRELRAFGISDGVDASFMLVSHTAFSWRFS
jgi:NAD-dependent SIR2 family protein deacetylase